MVAKCRGLHSWNCFQVRVRRIRGAERTCHMMIVERGNACCVEAVDFGCRDVKASLLDCETTDEEETAETDETIGRETLRHIYPDLYSMTKNKEASLHLRDRLATATARSRLASQTEAGYKES